MFVFTLAAVFSSLYAYTGARGKIEMCVGQTTDISCSQGELMLFDEAMFGVSNDVTRCSYTDGDCHSALEFQQAQLKCFGRQNCSLSLRPRLISCNEKTENVSYFQADYHCFSEKSRQNICSSNFTLLSGYIQIMNPSYPNFEKDTHASTCNCSLLNPNKLPINIILIDFEIPYGSINTYCPVSVIVTQDGAESIKKCVFQGKPWLAEIVNTTSSRIDIQLQREKDTPYKMWTNYRVLSGDPDSVVLQCGIPETTTSTPEETSSSTSLSTEVSVDTSTTSPVQTSTSSDPAPVSKASFSLFGLSLEILIVIAVAIVLVIVIIFVTCVFCVSKKKKQKPRHPHQSNAMNNRLYSKVDNRTKAQNGGHYDNPAFDDEKSTNQINTSDNIRKESTNGSGVKVSNNKMESPENIHSVDEITLVMNDVSGLDQIYDKQSNRMNQSDAPYNSHNEKV